MKKVHRFYFCTVILFIILFFLPYILWHQMLIHLGVDRIFADIVYWVYVAGLTVMIFLAFAAKSEDDKVKFSIQLIRKRIYWMSTAEFFVLVMSIGICGLNHPTG